jgi:hypothetical protein
MPNAIKYSTGTETLALKKGNFYIGTGAVGKGPTSETGYYNGITPPSGGYTIYLNKASGGPSIYTASNDAQLISLTNSIAGQSYTGTQQCFDYFYGQTDKLLVNQDYPADYPYIVMDGLTGYFDAKINNSYSGSGSLWNNVNGLGPKNNISLINSPTYSTNYGGIFLLDATNDYFSLSGTMTGNTWSAFIWFFYDGQTQFQLRGHRTFFATNTFRYQWDDVSSTTLGYGPFIDFVGGGGTPRGSVTPETLFNKWHCVGITSDGSSIKTYMDETLVGTTNINKQFSTNGSLRIGIDGISGIGSLDWFFESGGNNYIGPFMLYNRALTSAEVLQNYNAQKSRFGL